MQQWYNCPKCGCQVTFGLRFCGNCGAQLNWPTQQQIQPVNSYEQQKEDRKSGFKAKWKIAIVLTIVLICALGLFKVLVWDSANTFVSENSLTIVKAISHENGIELVTNTDIKSTTFHTGQGIYPKEKGLQKGISYACRVINKSGEAVIPLDKWPVFRISEDEDSVQRGEFNKSDWLPLSMGDYVIQLVRIEKAQGIIIAESNLSIVPYDKQILSKTTAYLTVEGDLDKYYDSYTVKGSDSVTAWVQSPKGAEINGMVKFFMTNSEGDIDKTSWVGVRETTFRTNPDGEPVSVGNLSGNPPPGIYNYEIIIDGDVVFHLKHICEVPSL